MATPGADDGEPFDEEHPVPRDVHREAGPNHASTSDAEVTDSLPADLDVTALESDYEFPNNSRRRIPGAIYLGLGLLAIVLWLVFDDSALVNRGYLFGGIGLMVFGAYHIQAGWDLAIDERDALVAATREVGFPVGHASAQLGWRGLRSRPTWRILVYSNEAPPSQRGLVMVDGVDGGIVDQFVEDNPEDWTGYEDA